ncbi:crotonase/enoyl-CoA hydratase family protein [Acaricomes phytoseiuli]|uniref:crotonase/enoyl-CoA hydratase family protein n=1 Tax=Acaricomes phytoseiuli TaxID=291968 RepID=UPI0003661E64|nr:crotonase/enoyl-CoA hydratase family protein [Acaricomes phytoseiuli]MCW1250415.1 crotonase/enoyl-CoA hydratase family protein [Acaricomes phytoseiuli]
MRKGQWSYGQAAPVQLSFDGPVAHLALNRPEKLNAINGQIIVQIPAAARAIRKNRQIRAVVLSGNGTDFSSGTDIREVFGRRLWVAKSLLGRPWQGANAFQEAFWSLRRLPVPVIAVIRGRAYGAGAQLALAADMRIAHPDAELSIMEAQWGLIPDMTGSVALSQLVGIDQAKRLTMTAEKLTAQRAKDLGLLTEIAVDPGLAAVELAHQLASRSPDAVAAAKRLLDVAYGSSPGKALRTERYLQWRLILGRNAAIARRAGLQQIAPRFLARQLWK